MSSARTDSGAHTKSRSVLTTLVNWGLSRQERARAWLGGRAHRPAFPAPSSSPKVDALASLVILNWKRPDNVRLILDRYVSFPRLDEIIVWNNAGATPFAYAHAKVRCINSDELGLSTRWLGCLIARHTCVIVHDDDLVCDEPTIDGLIASHYREPNRTYTLHGRNPTPANQYAEKVDHVREPTECDVHLTRATCVNRRLVPRYFDALTEMGLDIDPARGGGEDIVFSYAVRAATGLRPVVVPGSYEDLVARHGLANRNGPQEHDRTRIMRACQRWMERERVEHAS